MASTTVRFVPSQRGFIDLRNEGFVQKECLGVAHQVAGIASGKCGRAFRCDVRPGRARCHARASCDVPTEPRDEWCGGAFSGTADAALAAARAFGGQASPYWAKGR